MLRMRNSIGNWGETLWSEMPRTNMAAGSMLERDKIKQIALQFIQNAGEERLVRTKTTTSTRLITTRK